MNPRLNRPLSLLAATFLCFTMFTANASAFQLQCGTCSGGANADSANGGANCTGESVSITANVSGADCYLVFNQWGSPPYSCKPQDCSAEVTRTWAGLPANSPMEWCTTYTQIPNVQRCWKQPNGSDPSSGASGSGTSILSEVLTCGLTGNFSIETQCGTVATATVECTYDC